MADFRVDLDNCADEPIHIPGSIQPHGALLAVDDAELIAVASENSSQWFGVPAPGALGRPLTDVIGSSVDRLRPYLLGARPGSVDEVRLHDGRLDGALASIYRSGDVRVIEFETDDESVFTGSTTRSATMSINQASTVVETAHAAVMAVRRLTGFDRVMFYRFDRDWNG